jgi:hypothetical protein
MSYPVKRTITNILSGIAILTAYCITAWGSYRSGEIATDNLRAWAGLILTFIGIGIVATIIIQIVFHILLSISVAVSKKIQNEKFDDKEIEKQIGAEMIEDEMDRLIELKSLRVGAFVAGLGFVAGLVSLLLNHPPALMLNIFFLSFLGGSILEGFAQLFLYVRGVSHA